MNPRCKGLASVQWCEPVRQLVGCQPWIDKYVVCAAVCGMHFAVCASARVWPGGLLPSHQEAEYSFPGFIPTNKQSNKQTNIVALQTPGCGGITNQTPKKKNRGEAFLCVPKGGFRPDEFSKKNIPWVPYLFKIMSDSLGETQRRQLRCRKWIRILERWCLYTPASATETVLPSMHYARSVISRSGAALRRYRRTLFKWWWFLLLLSTVV